MKLYRQQLYTNPLPSPPCRPFGCTDGIIEQCIRASASIFLLGTFCTESLRACGLGTTGRSPKMS